MAKKIQIKFRITNFIKKIDIFKNFDLDNKSKTLSFNQFKKIILDKKLLEETKDMLYALNNYKKGIDLNPRLLITIYLIVNYSDEFLGEANDRHFSDTEILLMSQEMYLSINSCNETNVSTFWNQYHNYTCAFKNWIKMDKPRTIERAIVSYYYRSEHIEKINEDIKNTSESTQLIEMKQELEKQRADILKSIKIIDRSFDIEYLKDNYKLVYANLEKSWKTMITSLSTNMKKAYYDMLVEDLEKDNKINVFNLMKEIVQRVLLICPEKRKKSLETKFTEDILSDCLLCSNWNMKLEETILLIIDLVILLGASIDDEENKKWKLVVINEMKIANYNETLPKILIQIEEKLDRIYQLIVDFNEKNN